MSNPVSHVDALVAEFSSLLDEALVIALVSDHDLDDPEQLAQARDTLQTIAKDVPAEEATGFNPSGIADAFSSGDGTNEARDRASTSHGSSSNIRDTDSCCTTITSPNLDSLEPPATRIRAFEGQSDEYQVLQLQEMFGNLKVHDVQLAFRKAQGDFQSALEHLLNIQYLESIGERQKGVDGFFRPEGPSDSKRKRRKKGKQQRDPSSTVGSSSSSTITSPSSPNPHGRSINETEDILYVAEKLDLPCEEVEEVYRTSRSREQTIVQFLERYMQEGVRVNDQAGKQLVKELSQVYKSIPEHYLAPLVGLVGDVMRFVDEVAALLNPYFASLPPQRLALDYKLAPLVGEEIEGFSPVTTKRKAPAYSPLASGSTTPKTQSYTEALAKANAAAAARNQSYSNASAAFRKGGSNPLFRQAAGFYAEQAREQSVGVASARSAAADALVSGSASPDVIDLHGVEVADGVRIARERVRAWWQNLGEYRAQEARRGFTVITGLGRHSAGGVSRLRQNVAAALIEDGWKVAVETGRFKVTGRR